MAYYRIYRKALERKQNIMKDMTAGQKANLPR